MLKVAPGLYINESEILKNELQMYKDSITAEIKEYGYMVKFEWEEDKIKYSYASEMFRIDSDVNGEKPLTLEQINIINGFNNVISYYESKNI